MKLAAAVSHAALGGVDDTPPLLEAAARAGDTVRLIDWRDKTAEWTWPDAVLLHAPWDYTQHVAEFRDWLRSLSMRKPVFNSWPQIAANSHKGYLLDLAGAGVPIPRTRLLRAGTAAEEDLTLAFGDSPVVIKPAVGSGGRRMGRFGTVSEVRSSPLLKDDGTAREDLIVQAFVPSVETGGEFSLVMISGEPTHVIHKTPAAGQFRVQARFGGRARRVAIDGPARDMTEIIRPHIRDLAYARIDYLLDEHSAPLLMELEATEPDLFLAHAPEAASALLEHIRARTSAAH